MSRAILTIAILISVFIFPWWVACVLAVTGTFLFDYAEIVIVGALLDALYGLYGFPRILFTSLALLVFAVALYIKPKLSLYNPL
jgi:hypothetical protein